MRLWYRLIYWLCDFVPAGQRKANKPKQVKGVYRWVGTGWLVVGLQRNGVKDYQDPARVIWDLLP